MSRMITNSQKIVCTWVDLNNYERTWTTALKFGGCEAREKLNYTGVDLTPRHVDTYVFQSGARLGVESRSKNGLKNNVCF